MDGPGAGRTGSYLQGRSAQEMLGSVSMESHGDAPIVLGWFNGLVSGTICKEDPYEIMGESMVSGVDFLSKQSIERFVYFMTKP